MKKLLFLVLLTISNASAITVKDYLVLRKTGNEHRFLSGYIEALEDSIYFFAGCDLQNPPKEQTAYNAIKLELDLQIDRMLSFSSNKEQILKESLNILLIPILKSELDCKNPDAIQMKDLEKTRSPLYKEELIKTIRDLKKK